MNMAVELYLSQYEEDLTIESKYNHDNLCKVTSLSSAAMANAFRNCIDLLNKVALCTRRTRRERVFAMHRDGSLRVDLRGIEDAKTSLESLAKSVLAQCKSAGIAIPDTLSESQLIEKAYYVAAVCLGQLLWDSTEPDGIPTFLKLDSTHPAIVFFAAPEVNQLLVEKGVLDVHQSIADMPWDDLALEFEDHDGLEASAWTRMCPKIARKTPSGGTDIRRVLRLGCVANCATVIEVGGGSSGLTLTGAAVNCDDDQDIEALTRHVFDRRLFLPVDREQYERFCSKHDGCIVLGLFNPDALSGLGSAAKAKLHILAFEDSVSRISDVQGHTPFCIAVKGKCSKHEAFSLLWSTLCRLDVSACSADEMIEYLATFWDNRQHGRLAVWVQSLSLDVKIATMNLEEDLKDVENRVNNANAQILTWQGDIETANDVIDSYETRRLLKPDTDDTSARAARRRREQLQNDLGRLIEARDKLVQRQRNLKQRVEAE